MKSASGRIILIILACFFLMSSYKSSATHLMGGELTYVHDGTNSGGNFYAVTLIIYRYCDSTLVTASLDPSMFLGIYTDGGSGVLDWYSTESLSLVSSSFITSNPNTPGCNFTASACIERGEYLAYILLPDNQSGYELFVERCCRNGNIVNIDNPGNAGMTFNAFIPPGIINSSPQITDISVPYLCAGDTVSIINNAYDPDGDSLAYSFVTPYNGYSGPMVPVPDPFTDNNPYLTPVPDIVYASSYSFANVFGAGGYASIDPTSGLTIYYIPNQGFYVAAIEIREYRNGILLSKIRRDLQFITILCSPNTVPDFIAGTGGTVFTVGEGQPLCFNVSFSDSDGDSLFLSASGPLLDTAVVNPAGIIQDASGDSVVSSQFCWTPVCGTSRPQPYQFFVTVTDNGCPAKTSNEIFSVYVTTGPGSQTANVIIQQAPGIICQGSISTFTVTTINGGSSPQFFWEINGVAAGTNDTILNAANLSNGDVITVTMVSNADCLLNDTAVSPPFVVAINNQPAPQINITSNPANFLCPQQICLFTANVSNGGTNPVYQWNLNGLNAGTNNSLFIAANPSGTMTVYVTVIPSTGCPPEISNQIFYNIVPTLVPQITLTASFTDSICPGQPVAFNASANNTGNPPMYSWYLNGILTGDTTSALIIPSFSEGDEVYATATSTYQCLSPDKAVSDALVFHIYPQVSVNVTDGPITICSGTPVSLDLIANGGGIASYQYQWNGIASTQNYITFNPLLTGYYSGTVDDICYNPVSDSLFIEVLPVPVSDFTWEPVVPSVFEPHVQFTDKSINAISWLWMFDNNASSNEQHPAYDYRAGGFYPVQLITTSLAGCTDTLIRILEVEDFITAYIPNSFTPNGDGKNDDFGMVGASTGGYAMKIFNRWGQEIFSSEYGYEKWNGYGRDGKLLSAGVYIYNFFIRNDPSNKPYTGTVNLVR